MKMTTKRTLILGMVRTLGVVSFLCGLRGCSKSGGDTNSTKDIPDGGDPAVNENAGKTDEKLLFDYYEAVVGTVGGDCYDEITITETEGAHRLHVYHKDDGAAETHVVFPVGKELLDTVMGLVGEYGMEHWGELSGEALDGKQYVVKFRDQNDTLIRVSSDNMPENGTSAFGAVRQAMWSAVEAAKKEAK
ncbi:MAG: hypothetical protein MJ175_04950 [Clostridia bacterium]|nr:hypothetical protein [Clostridia bacterium]